MDKHLFWNLHSSAGNRYKTELFRLSSAQGLQGLPRDLRMAGLPPAFACPLSSSPSAHNRSLECGKAVALLVDCHHGVYGVLD